METTTRLAVAGAAACILACATTIAVPLLIGGGGALALGDALGWEAAVGALLAAGGVGLFVLRRKRRSPHAVCGCTPQDIETKRAPEATPVACTLSAEAMPARLAEIAALARDALVGHERDDLTLLLRYRRAGADRVREMVRKERACCAFLDFDVREEVDAIIVTIRAPESARNIADYVFGQFVGAA